MAAPKRPTMMDPPVESLLDKVESSKFTLVTLAAKRGRQINSYFNQLGEGLGAIVPPQVTSVSRKPLSIALEEIAAGKIVFIPAPEIEEGEEGGEVVLEAISGGASTDTVDGGDSGGDDTPAAG